MMVMWHTSIDQSLTSLSSDSQFRVFVYVQFTWRLEWLKRPYNSLVTFFFSLTEEPSEEQVEAIAKIQQFLNDELKLNGGKCKVEPNDRAAKGWVGRIPLKGEEADLITKTYAIFVEFATDYMDDEDTTRVGDALMKINSVTPFVWCHLRVRLEILGYSKQIVHV